tara:strand:- start:9 stop:710 length:702 start_codon:yes stop_codon:yes gene_type:complete
MLENFKLLDEWRALEAAPLSTNSLLINLFIGFILALLIKFHYKKYGSTLSNRNEFSNVFIFVLLTTVLVISIVKSSLALSLGLVGALSIVRFRTPIKEPEELAYLFISIAAGLGLGANQTIPTIVSVIFILVSMTILKFRKVEKEKNMYITINYEITSEKETVKILDNINQIISNELNSFDLRRVDTSQNSIELNYLVNLKNIKSLEKIIEKLQKDYPKISINYLDQNQVPSI